jgi:hypothetical protein
MPDFLRWSLWFILVAATAGCSGSNSTNQAPAAKQTDSPTAPGKQQPAAKQQEGQYELLGVRGSGAGRRMVSKSGTLLKDAPLEIEWELPKGAYEKLKEGMSLDDARKVLGLETLTFTPLRPDGQLQLVCKDGSVSVTLIFSGSPEVKLTSKSIKGFK